jgi:uncharacterized Zn finger protein (UPF0148 family)
MKTCPNCKKLFSKNQDGKYFCDDCGWFEFDEQKKEWRPCDEPKQITSPKIEIEPKKPELETAKLSVQDSEKKIIPPVEPLPGVCKKAKRIIDLIFFWVEW